MIYLMMLHVLLEIVEVVIGLWEIWKHFVK
jgi:hypothetical protein